uniref:Uncharacterized protein n=1 Tax=Caenorhabditis japonica TaxID=281687 RepID=A0A8R1HXM2_CAEJA
MPTLFSKYAYYFNQLCEFSPNRLQAQKAKNVAPVRYPTPVQKNMNLMVDFKVENKVIGYSLASKQHAHGNCLVHFQSTINRILKPDSFVVPRETVAISICNSFFTLGSSPTDFVKTKQGGKPLPEDSYFTYKMVTKHVMIVLYNSEGAEEQLAGFVYYPQLLTSRRVCPNIDETAMALARITYSSDNGPEMFARFCKKTQRDVIVKIMNGGMSATHMDYNYILLEQNYGSCSECNAFHQEKMKKEKKEKKKSITEKAASKSKSKSEAATATETANSTVTPPPKTAPPKAVDSDDEYDFGN